MLHPGTEAPQFHLLTREPVVLGEVRLLGGLGHLGLEFRVSGVVFLLDHVRRYVQRDAMGERVAKVREMFEPLVTG
jgi:hypothetical protein